MLQPEPINKQIKIPASAETNTQFWLKPIFIDNSFFTNGLKPIPIELSIHPSIGNKLELKNK